MKNLLLDEKPLFVLPQFAVKVGLDEAIVLQQLHYLLREEASNGRIINDKKWIFNTYENWQKNYFPFWGIDKLKKIFISLEKSKLVFSCQPEGGISRRKYYRINMEEVCKDDENDHGAKRHDRRANPHVPDGAKRHDPIYTEYTTELNEEEYIPESGDEETAIVNDKMKPSKAKTESSETTNSAAQGNDLFATEENDGRGGRGPTPEQVIARWNSLFVYGFVRKLSKKAVTRLKAMNKDKDFRENWSEAIALIQTIPWMMGKTATQFEMSIEYFLTDDCFCQIMNRGNKSKLPQKKEATVRKKSIADLRKEIDSIKFQAWLKEQIPTKYREWDEFNCPETTIKEFLEQTT